MESRLSRLPPTRETNTWNSVKENGLTEALLARFAREEAGQDLIEYGLLVGVITATAVLTVRSLGEIVMNFYTQLQTVMTQ